jgi:hypothetical protein
MGTSWISKDVEFYLQLKNINFPLLKLHQKEDIGKIRCLKNDFWGLLEEKTLEKKQKTLFSHHRIL